MAHLFRTRNKKTGEFHSAWRFEIRMWNGKRQSHTGYASKPETAKLASKIQREQDEIKRGYRPPPKASDKPRAFGEIVSEYIAWGEAQGGHGGRPWGKGHLFNRKRHLTKFWPDRLHPVTLLDLTLPRVEAVARELIAAEKANKTVQSHVESIKALCLWAKGRGYLEANPLEGFAPFDVTPVTKRRALSEIEIARLLSDAPPERRLVYEVALCTGFRKKELAALKVKDLNLQFSTLYLSASDAKSRKDACQPIPAALAAKLSNASANREPDASLLMVSNHIDRYFRRDMGITADDNPDIVFHSLRHTYCTAIFEVGAHTKEAQTLMRHADVKMTMRYSHTQQHRLQSAAEAVGERLLRNHKIEPIAGTAPERLAVGAESVCAAGSYEKPIMGSMPVARFIQDQ